MDINKQCKRYIVQVIVILAVLSALGIAAEKIWDLQLLGQQAMSTIFFLAVELTVILVWRWVMLKKQDLLPSFLMGVSGLRFFGALIVMLIWFLAVGRETVMTFLVVFFVYYMAMVIHQSTFFTKVSNRL